MKQFFWVVILSGLLFVYGNCGGFKSFKSAAYNFLSSDSATPGLFKIDRQQLKILPYDIRMSKLKSVVGSNDQALYADLESRKAELGSYDFSQGLSQDLSWQDARLKSWTQGLQQVCTSSQFKAKFSYPAQAQLFVETAFGRPANAQDQEIISQVAALNASNDDKSYILCTVVLSSLEFVAQ